MNGLEQWFRQISHNYLLIAAAAILFFAFKAVVGYFTYRHYDQRFKSLNQKIDQLLKRGEE